MCNKNTRIVSISLHKLNWGEIMDKKLPKVFANKIDKNIANNEKVYYSSKMIKDEELPRESKIDDKNIYQKINDIFSSEKYVYKANVDIKLKNGNKTAKIIGHNNGYLITIDNELIPISDIEDINLRQ